MTNSCTRAYDWYQNQRPWMTLIGHYALSFEFEINFRRPLRNYEQRSTHQQRRCSPMSLASGNIRFMRIFAGVPWWGGVKRQWDCRQEQFPVFSLAVFRNFRDKASIFIQEYGIPRRLSTDPRTRDLEWLWVAILRYFCQIQVQDLLVYLHGQRVDIYGYNICRRFRAACRKFVS